MAGELVNPYANPYLPSFVNQRPTMNTQQPMIAQPAVPSTMLSYDQIHSVKGFDGADAYAMSKMANGTSAILAEEDPNMARIYIVAKDANGQVYVQGHDLSAPVERPKPITMDDLNSKMNQMLDRLTKLEEDKSNGNQPVPNASWKNPGKSGGTGNQPAGRNGQNGTESVGGNPAGGTK